MIWPYWPICSRWRLTTSSDSSASRRSSGVLADSIILSKDAACTGVVGKATTLGLSEGSIPLTAPIVVPVGRHDCDSESLRASTPPPPSCPASCSWRVPWPTRMPGSRALRRHLVECCRYGQTIIRPRCPGRYRLVPGRLCRHRCFLGVEALARTPGSASSLNASREDQGTTRMLAITYGLATELPLVLRRLPAPQLPPMAGPAGLMVQAAGLALRAWSMRTLGASYSRTLRAGQEQHVVDTGPYRLVRHPGYTGSLLTWTGFALASRSPLVLALVAALLGGPTTTASPLRNSCCSETCRATLPIASTSRNSSLSSGDSPSRDRRGLQGEEGSFPKGEPS
jgi:hypothetical protein